LPGLNAVWRRKNGRTLKTLCICALDRRNA